MMKVETFARELETKGIRLALRDEKIICSGSSEALTPDLIETLRRRKPEIQEFLKSSLGKDEPTPSPADIPPAPVESVPGQDEGVNPYTEQKPQNGDSAPPPAPALDDWRKRYTALTEAEKAELHARMWPTPSTSPPRKPESPGPDIGKLVSRWPKAARLEFAGRVGKYSNEMPINQAMARAYSELKDDAQENKP